MDYTATQDDELNIEFAEVLIADVLKQTGSERIWAYCPRLDACGYVPISLVVPPVVWSSPSSSLLCVHVWSWVCVWNTASLSFIYHHSSLQHNLLAQHGHTYIQTNRQTDGRTDRWSDKRCTRMISRLLKYSSGVRVMWSPIWQLCHERQLLTYVYTKTAPPLPKGHMQTDCMHLWSGSSPQMEPFDSSSSSSSFFSFWLQQPLLLHLTGLGCQTRSLHCSLKDKSYPFPFSRSLCWFSWYYFVLISLSCIHHFLPCYVFSVFVAVSEFLSYCVACNHSIITRSCPPPPPPPIPSIILSSLNGTCTGMCLLQ